MPIHLPPTSRRAFLHRLALGGAAMAVPGARATSLARREEPGSYIALMSDVHIDASPTRVVRQNYHLSENLRVAVADVLAQPRPPAAVAVLGDLALKNGKPGDYAQFLSLVSPIRDRGIPIYLTLGNHDDRDAFRKALGRGTEPVEDRCASLVDVAGIRMILLDTLVEVDKVPGLIGETQMAWLTRTLDAAPDVPTMLFMHHHPSPTPENPAVGTLGDTKALLEAIRPRSQVKALVFGHTHVWRREVIDGVHHVNVPAVAYPSAASPQPIGWCRLEPRPDGAGAIVELNCTGGDRASDGERVDLAWRGA